VLAARRCLSPGTICPGEERKTFFASPAGGRGQAASTFPPTVIQSFPAPGDQRLGRPRRRLSWSTRWKSGHGIISSRDSGEHHFARLAPLPGLTRRYGWRCLPGNEGERGGGGKRPNVWATRRRRTELQGRLLHRRTKSAAGRSGRFTKSGERIMGRQIGPRLRRVFQVQDDVVKNVSFSNKLRLNLAEEDRGCVSATRKRHEASSFIQGTPLSNRDGGRIQESNDYSKLDPNGSGVRSGPCRNSRRSFIAGYMYGSALTQPSFHRGGTVSGRKRRGTWMIKLAEAQRFWPASLFDWPGKTRSGTTKNCGSKLIPQFIPSLIIITRCGGVS